MIIMKRCVATPYLTTKMAEQDETEQTIHEEENNIDSTTQPQDDQETPSELHASQNGQATQSYGVPMIAQEEIHLTK